MLHLLFKDIVETRLLTLGSIAKPFMLYKTGSRLLATDD